MKTIAVDFDGVIHQYSNHWQDGVIYDKPVEGAFEKIIDLLPSYDIAINSTRNQYPDQIIAMKQWFLKWGFPEHYLKELKFPTHKIKAIAYIDDRAIRFTNWQDMRKYFI